MSIYVWTGRINYPAMRWPCLYGYHIWMYNEWNAIKNAWITLWAWTSTWGTDFSKYLKMPFSWYRLYNSGNVSDQWTTWYYWVADKTSNWTRWLVISASLLNLSRASYRSYWNSIRPIKDSPEKPTSSWTTLYDWSSIATWAWIFQNTTSWFISISADWNTRYTIADKNLWATAVWNYWDTLSETNCGKYFQFWNNYPFPYTGSITISSTQVDASSYWPWNWYYSSTFVKWASDSPYDRSSPVNDNLRWYDVWQEKAGVKDICVGKWLDDYSTRQWPCPAWFHVPSQTEWINLHSKWQNIWAWTSGQWNVMAQYIKCPSAWYLQFNNASKYQSWSEWRYSTQSISVSFRMNSTAAQVISHNWTDWTTMRPFKDTPVEADSTWTVLFSGTNWKWIWRHKWLWLISLYDWSSWTTIADKNLWATKAWNSWDSLNESNCWYYYQWWNNYWFPYSWPSSTATSQVDVSNYWPTNPYYSNTFIKRSSSPYPRGTSSFVINRSTGNQVSAYYNLWWQYLPESLYKWNVKQVYVGTTPARPTYNPWIYWNKAKWLISISSDWKNWYTISDRNAGAKIVYNYGDTLNTDNAWGLYQRWNNYPFPYTWSITTSSTRVSTSWYSWSNPYYSSTFIKTSGAPHDWSSNQNANLWWDTTNTIDARRWPCDNWFHVPTQTELYWLRTTMVTWLGITTTVDWSKYLKIPLAWVRGNQWWSASSWVEFDWLTSTTNYWTYSYIRAIYWSTSWSWLVNTSVFSTYTSYWYSVRPFKNEPVVPDNTWTCLHWWYVLKLPLNTTYTYTDQSPLKKTVINNWVQFWTYAWVNCAYFNGSSRLQLPDIKTLSDFTISFRFYKTQATSNTSANLLSYWNASNVNYHLRLRDNLVQQSIKLTWNASTWGSTTSWSVGLNARYLYTLTKKWSLVKQYIRWTLNKTWDWHIASSQIIDAGGKLIWWNLSYNIWKSNYASSWWVNYVWYLSDFRIINWAQSDADVTAYYNSVKSTYWL